MVYQTGLMLCNRGLGCCNDVSFVVNQLSYFKKWKHVGGGGTHRRSRGEGEEERKGRGGREGEKVK